MIIFYLIPMEFEDVKNSLGYFVVGTFFLLMGLALITEEEIVNPNEPDVFFFMTVILAIMLLIAGVLINIVGIYGIVEVYRQDKIPLSS